MIQVKSRSVESWGPLAKCSDAEFNRILNNRKGDTKDLIKKVKKLKTYRVTFKKHFCSDQFEIRAESDYAVSEAARKYFKENESKIGFVAEVRSPWASSYPGYDSFSYVKVK
jgi:hypothetical protein